MTRIELRDMCGEIADKEVMQKGIKENYDAKDIVLNIEEIATIRRLDEGKRLVNGSWAPEWDV